MYETKLMTRRSFFFFSGTLPALSLTIFLYGSFPLRAGDPHPTHFQKRGTVFHISDQGTLTARVQVPESLRRRSAESIEQYFLGRDWRIRNDEGYTIGSFRCLRVQEQEEGLDLFGLYTPIEKEPPRAGMEFGEFLPVERVEPPARIILRKRERPRRIKSEIDGKEMILINQDYLVFGQGLDPSADNFNPRFFDRNVSVTPLIKAFYMDRTEVTNEEYYRFSRRARHPLPPEWKDGFPVERAKEPFLFARYSDALAYARWSEKRLPTEFEWELAARGGLRSRPDEAGFDSAPPSYPGGDSSRCNTAEAWSGRIPRPVAVSDLQDATPAGIVGLCGNAPEWTSSFFAPYPGHRLRNFEGRLRRVIRGGAYFLPLERARAESRSGAAPDGPVRAGFRLVRELR